MKNILSGFQKRYFKISLKNIIFFLFNWFCIGFICGTGLLMGPVRWIADLAQEKQWDDNTENLIVKLAIVLLVLVSFYLTLILTRSVVRSKKMAVKIVVTSGLGVLTIFIIWLWMNPSIMIRDTGEPDVVEQGKNAEFHFGNYPTEEDLVRLKEDGYTAVISLLHTAVVPFEPKLLAEEKALAEKVGIGFIHVPMLPWISENNEAIKQIEDLAINGEGKYFVHCYLGKDRVNVTKRIIRSVQKDVVIIEQGITHRSLDEIDSFERGKIFQLSRDIYFTPFPTDEEYFGYIISGSFKQVVSLLDPDNPDDLILINKEKKFLADYQIPFQLTPVLTEPYDANKTLEDVRKIKDLPKPLLIHAFLTKGTVSEALMNAFESDLPSLPPTLFMIRMKKSPVSILLPNVAAGGSPTVLEFKSYLYDKGIRKIGFVGNKTSASSRRLKAAAEKVGLEWNDVDIQSFGDIERLKTGGPWYVFGASIEDIQNALGAINEGDE